MPTKKRKRECSKQFHYHALPTSPPWIRLLRIRPGQKSEPLECDIIEVDLNENGSAEPRNYHALSYVWGRRGSTVEISVSPCPGHQCQLQISTNMLAMLTAYRTQDSHKLVWVDQLCIDQSSFMEKKSQIALMKTIYEKAERVRIWLGPAADDSDIAMDALKVLRQRMKCLYGSCDSREEVLEKLSLLDMLDEPGPKVDREWNAIRALFCRPWWHRTRILQEATALHGARTLVSCGEKHLLLFDFLSLDVVLHAALTKVRVPGFDLIYHSGVRRPVHEIWKFRSMRRKSSGRYPLYQLLTLMRPREASDPRDKIYSTLRSQMTRRKKVPSLSLTISDLRGRYMSTW
jgi:hypothetical protein